MKSSGLAAVGLRLLYDLERQRDLAKARMRQYEESATAEKSNLIRIEGLIEDLKTEFKKSKADLEKERRKPIFFEMPK